MRLRRRRRWWWRWRWWQQQQKRTHSTKTNYIEKCTPHSTPFDDDDGDGKGGKGNQIEYGITISRFAFRFVLFCFTSFGRIFFACVAMNVCCVFVRAYMCFPETIIVLPFYVWCFMLLLLLILCVRVCVSQPNASYSY